MPFNNDTYVEPPYKDRDSRLNPKRYVQVNFDYLKEADSVVLNLFENMTFTAVKDSIDRRSEHQYSWFGHIDDMEQSSTVLIIDNGIMVGNIRIDGKFYQIRPTIDGVHVNELRLQTCGQSTIVKIIGAADSHRAGVAVASRRVFGQLADLVNRGCGIGFFGNRTILVGRLDRGQRQRPRMRWRRRNGIAKLGCRGAARVWLERLSCLRVEMNRPWPRSIRIG